MKFWTVFLLCLIAATFTNASTYYVSVFGTNTAPCSSNLPCATLAEALNKAKKGDTISIAAGVYQGSGNIGITIPVPLNIVAQPNAQVIFNCQQSQYGWLLNSNYSSMQYKVQNVSFSVCKQGISAQGVSLLITSGSTTSGDNLITSTNSKIEVNGYFVTPSTGSPTYSVLFSLSNSSIVFNNKISFTAGSSAAALVATNSKIFGVSLNIQNTPYALQFTNCDVVLIDSIIANGQGSGISATNSHVNLYNTQISGNVITTTTGNAMGAGVNINGGSLRAHSTQIVYNSIKVQGTPALTFTNYGAGACFVNTDVTFINGSISNNTANIGSYPPYGSYQYNIQGVGFYASASTVKFMNSTVSSNYATSFSGYTTPSQAGIAFTCLNNAAITMVDTNAEYNVRAPVGNLYGGLAYCPSSCTISVTGGNVEIGNSTPLTNGQCYGQDE